jgi:hypothetical protein
MLYTVECGRCGKRSDLALPLIEWGNWPDCCGEKTRQVILPKEIMPDIAPYRTVAADIDGSRKHIGSRKEHREFLKRNRLVELGTEIPKSKAPEYDPGPRKEFREDIRRAIREVRARG